MVQQNEGPITPTNKKANKKAVKEFEEFAEDVHNERDKELDALESLGEDKPTPIQISIGVGAFIVVAVIIGVIGWAINEYVVE